MSKYKGGNVTYHLTMFCFKEWTFSSLYAEGGKKKHREQILYSGSKNMFWREKKDVHFKAEMYKKFWQKGFSFICLKGKVPLPLCSLKMILKIYSVSSYFRLALFHVKDSPAEMTFSLLLYFFLSFQCLSYPEYF